MSKMKRLFVVSDIHGHYTILKNALAEAGFDETNDDHILISCGDLFDRGTENRKVYDYIKGIEHKVLICGNHDERLKEILTEKRLNVCDIHSRMHTTIEELFGIGTMDEYGELNIADGDPLARELCDFVDGMSDYYETEHYVFVHGWIPTLPRTKPLQPIENWREADAGLWHSARYIEWQELHGVNDMLPEKTIVCGHRPTRLACSFDPSRSMGDSSIYYGEKMIAIDAGTASSGRMNVLVIEDNIEER